MAKKYYDPDPSSKRSRVPPQLRAWVFGRRKKRAHDPTRRRRRRYDPGTAGVLYGKPYARGRRGGVYWSRGRKPRYDPNYRKGWGRAKAKARGILGKVEANLMWIGLALGILIPSEVCRAKHKTNLTQHYVNGTIGETKRLFGADPTISSMDYIKYKFGLSYFGQSVWSVAFWGSLAAQILTRLNIVSMISKRANTDIKKLTMGTLIASIFGALFIQGGTPTASSTSPRTPDQRNANLTGYGGAY